MPPAPRGLPADRSQWICWTAAPSATTPDKLDKFPLDWRTGRVCGVNDRSAWTTRDVAEAMAPTYDRGYGAGAGFVFTADDPYWFLDADACRVSDGWSPLALSLSARLPGAACEVSQSGRGLHWFGRYVGPRPLHGCRNTPLGLELYTADRFVAVTGSGASGDAETDCTAALGALIADLFPASTAVTGGVGWTTEPCAEWRGPDDDDELIRRMLASASRTAAGAFGGGGVTVADLWNGTVDPLAAKWPPTRDGDPYNRSDVDQALIGHLAWWTGRNAERVERLMRRSALVRDKWDVHRTYLTDSIARGCAFVTGCYVGPEAVVTPPLPAVIAATRALPTDTFRDASREYLHPVEQLEHFAGCWFVSDLGEVFSLRHNSLMGRTVFDVVFGGHKFVMDAQGRKTTGSAWEAFTLNLVTRSRIASALCFRPEIPPGTIVFEGVRSFVNCYVPYECPVSDDDATPYLDFLGRLLPNARDRAILLAYMARMAQSPGVKLQWWPVLQGAQGNGKTLILEALAYIAGEQYTHRPNPAAMVRDGMKFNGWIDRKLFIGVEEIKVGPKRDFLEEFKTVVTNMRIPLEGKGTNQVNGDNRANGILLTNHKDGVPVVRDDRRYAVFFTPQQSAEDIERDGLGGMYLPRLYEWMRGPGSAAVAGYLKRYAIPAELDPAGALHRAPKTSSTEDAVSASLGRAEQEIQEAIAEGRQGFAGGWVSSRFLDLLLDHARVTVPRRRRREMMQALGYDVHPGLVDGRTNATVMPDGGKPVLYLRTGHLALNLTEPARIAEAYSKAQSADVMPAPGARTA